MKTRKSLLALTLLSFSATSYSMTSLADTHFSPAEFNFSGSDIAQQVTKSNPGQTMNIAVYCQSEIGAQGENLKTQCFEKSGNTTLEQQISKAVQAQSFTPASIDGEGIAVRMNYRVIYQQDDSSQSVILIPNLGSLQSKLGVNYVEPQERLMNGWFSKVSVKLAGSSSFFKHGGELVRAKATIKRDGQSSAVTMIDKGAQNSSIKNALKQAEFIPGFVDGKAVDMPYLAVVTH